MCRGCDADDPQLRDFWKQKHLIDDLSGALENAQQRILMLERQLRPTDRTQHFDLQFDVRERSVISLLKRHGRLETKQILPTFAVEPSLSDVQRRHALMNTLHRLKAKELVECQGRMTWTLTSYGQDATRAV